jgi:hypothetical protein
MGQQAMTGAIWTGRTPATTDQGDPIPATNTYPARRQNDGRAQDIAVNRTRTKVAVMSALTPQIEDPHKDPYGSIGGATHQGLAASARRNSAVSAHGKDEPPAPPHRTLGHRAIHAGVRPVAGDWAWRPRDPRRQPCTTQTPPALT